MTSAGAQAPVRDTGSDWQFDHIFVSMRSAEALRTLFENVMNMRDGYRPPFPVPGAWLYDGQQAVVHAVEDRRLPPPSGRVHFGHIAFRSEQPASQVVERLRSSGLPFQVGRVPAEQTAQIFVQLPGDFIVELDVPDDLT